MRRRAPAASPASAGSAPHEVAHPTVRRPMLEMDANAFEVAVGGFCRAYSAVVNAPVDLDESALRAGLASALGIYRECES